MKKPIRYNIPFEAKKHNPARKDMFALNLKEIDGVISDNCDYSLHTASIVAALLKLPFVDIQSAVLSNNKFKQRLIVRIHVPSSYEF